MGKLHDVIVIGAGQNGLSTAAYLAKAGLDVVVLEDKSWIGGNTVTKEITLPGFRHDVSSTVLAFALANPAIANDELELQSKYGLDLIYPEDNIVNLFDDDTALPVYEDLDKMCEAIAEFSQHDADAYRELINYLLPMVPLMAAGMYNAPPKMGLFFNQMDQTPLGQEFLRLMMMSAYDLVNRWFEHPKTKIELMNYATEAMVDPEQSGSAFYIVAIVATQHIAGKHMALPRGGMQGIPDSLARCIEDHGGSVLTDHEVAKITTRGGKVTGVVCANGEEFTARKAVISNVDPRLTLNKWLDTPLEVNLRKKIDQITEPAFSGIMTHIALDEDPTFKAGGKVSQTSVQPLTLPADLTEYRQSFIDMRLGRVPQPSKLMSVIPTRYDSTRAPEGKTIIYLWQFVPYFLNEGPAHWDNIKEDVSDKAMNKYFSFTTNISMKNVLGKYVISPLDFARNNQNMINGTILGPSPALYQYMSYRPIPELGQYRTPVEGLYLAGQAVHPGGGVTLGGRATAQVIMEDLGIDFDDVVS